MLASLRASIAQRLWHSSLSIVSLVTIAASLIFSLDEAKWFNDHAPLTVLVALGFAYGTLLAFTRFRARTTIIITGLLSIGLTPLIVGRVLPSPLTLSTWPFADSLWLAHVRLLTFFDQLNVALQSTLSGNFDKTLIVFVLGWLIWISSVWLVWSVVRRRQALQGIVPCAVVLVINILLNGHDASFPLLFTGSAVILIARTAFTQRAHIWDADQVGYPELITDDWNISAAIISFIIIALVAITSPEGRQTLNNFFTTLQSPPRSDQSGSVPGLLTNFINPNISALSAQVPDVTTVGGPIPPSDSDESVMWVKVSDPPPILEEHGVMIATQHYWRGGVFTHYNGTGWDIDQTNSVTASIGLMAEAPIGRYSLDQEFEIVAQHSTDLFAVNTPVRSSTGTSLRFISPDGNAVLEGTTSQYAVTSWASNASVAQLRADTTDYPLDVATAYLQLPDSLPQRVRDLAARITAEAETPYDKALRIQNYLRETYRYQLDVPRPPAGSDVVDYFLFDAPGGFCSYYASAMAVMLRVEGVPARIVTGFATGEYDQTRNAYRVPARAAHAWVEVYFPHYGWIEFEPTATLSTFTYKDDASVTSSPETPKIAPNYLPIEWRILIGTAGTIGFVVILWALIMRYRRQPHDPRWREPDRQSHALYWQMRRQLARAGLVARPNITPDEFLSMHASRLSDRPQLHRALQQVTTLYVRAAYTASLPEADDVKAARQRWRSVWPDWLRLWLRMFMQRLRRRP
jgi:transglutaminase-like putative cysteine protease